MKSRTWACVPVKDFSQAKQRLASVLSQSERSLLAEAMVQDVLDAVQAASGLAGIAILTVDPVARQLAHRRGLRVIHDCATEGHTRVANAAMKRLRAEGADAVLMLPGDVPLLTPLEVEAVLAMAPYEQFTIVPSHDHGGSNAILCSPPGNIPLRYGLDSFQCHLRAAQARGITPAVIELPGIAQDIDEPQDLDFILRSNAETRARSLMRGIAA
jgi:2-phospho-L-lactate guanylyltransferase